MSDTHATSRLTGAAPRSAVYLSDDQAFTVLLALREQFGKSAESRQSLNASATLNSGGSTAASFTDTFFRTSPSSSQSSWSTGAGEGEKLTSTLEEDFIDEFTCVYSMASIGSDLSWLKNLGEQMYLDPIQSLLDAAFDAPLAYSEESVDFFSDDVECNKPLADVPVDCGLSTTSCSSSFLEPAEDDQSAEDFGNTSKSTDAESVCSIIEGPIYERRQVPKVARDPIGKKLWAPSVLKAFARGLLGKKPSTSFQKEMELYLQKSKVDSTPI